MGQNRILAICLLFAAVAITEPAAAKRVALVIGNSDYQHATPLKNPKADAMAIADVLKRLKFDVVLGIDLKHRQFADTVNAFAEKLLGADVALLFYAGHGLQVHGRNYLAPIDAKLKHEAGLEFEAVRLSTIQALMERRNRTSLVFLDACRDNPLAKKLARNMGTRSAAVGRGWARVESGVGTLIAFATQPGNVALDGAGKHSPFADAFLRHAETPGLDIEGLMRRVRVSVIQATAGSQIPWSHSSLTQRFRFKKEQKTVAVAPRGQNQMELAFWQSARSNGTRQAYEAYLKAFPTGAFAALARLEIAGLSPLKADESAKPQPVDKKKPSARIAATEIETAALDPAPVPVDSPVKDPTLSGKALSMALQRELKRVGCYVGRVDGLWGAGSRGSLTKFARYAKLASIGRDPSQDILDAVKARTSRVCPVVCGPLYTLKGNNCVKKTCPSGQTLGRTGRCSKTPPKTKRVQARPTSKAKSKCNPAAIAALTEKLRRSWMERSTNTGASGVCFKCGENARRALCGS